MDTPNELEIVGAELARKKAETRLISKCLRKKKLAVKSKQKELKRVKRVNQLTIAFNRRMNNLVNEFLGADDETAKIWAEKAIHEAIEGMNDLIDLITLNQGSTSAADGDN